MTALSSLREYPQFVLFESALSKVPGKTDKIPRSAVSGRVCDPHDPANWATHEIAVSRARLLGLGVGFVLTESDPFWCLDIDSCLVDGGWSPLALELCAALPGAAVEVSTSGTGLHIWGRGAVPRHGCKNTALGIELYHDKRFIALGLPGAVGDAGTDCSDALAAVVGMYFPAPPTSEASADWTTEPSADWSGPTGDDELIRRMLASKPSSASTFGGRATVSQLWEADAAALATSYPSASGAIYDASSADAALAQHLAFWTGRDCVRIERLMRRSSLAREKWERRDYIEATILLACSASANVYRERRPDAADVQAGAVKPASQAGRLANGHTFLSPEDQLRLWEGYTYVTDANAILTSTGQMLNADQFKNRHGGSVFVMDTDNSKTTNNAWEAFTHSRAVRMPKVDHSAFRPDLDPSAIWDKDGESFVNSYRELNLTRTAGNPSPFLAHLAKVLPIKRDRDILLAYMAGVVQHKGVKFQWAPLIQGVEGNGKSLFSRCVAEAVGARYSHLPRASELAEKFNDWLVGKIFIGVEDVYCNDSRTDLVEVLKPMITNSRQPIRAMRQSERTVDICCNFIVNANGKDAIRKTTNDRRWCVMFCAQQSAEDLERDGMGGDYFSKLYGWLNGGGYAVVSEFLYSYQIPAEFGLTCLLSRAPETSSTEEALAVGLGRVEQEVLEAIAAESAGFCGGWVSSLALDRLLKDQRMDLAMPRSKRRDMMRSLGYDWHPALRGGRSTTALPGTTDRPILFIRKDHISCALGTGGAVVRAYVSAQAPEPSSTGESLAA